MLAVIGLGPGNADQVTPEASRAVAEARWFFGYGPYLDRLDAAARPDQGRLRQPRGDLARHGRARQGGRRRTRRRRLGRRSRRLRHGRRRLRGDRGRARPNGAPSTSTIVPGVTAMLAVAARIGAPLGHDFCAISLSDNLKPWELIEQRLARRRPPASSSRSTTRSARRGPGSLAAPSRCCATILPGDDAGHLRPRRRPARRAHRGRRRSPRPTRTRPTWRPAS